MKLLNYECYKKKGDLNIPGVEWPPGPRHTMGPLDAPAAAAAPTREVGFPRRSDVFGRLFGALQKPLLFTASIAVCLQLFTTASRSIYSPGERLAEVFYAPYICWHVLRGQMVQMTSRIGLEMTLRSLGTINTFFP